MQSIKECTLLASLTKWQEAIFQNGLTKNGLTKSQHVGLG